MSESFLLVIMQKSLLKQGLIRMETSANYLNNVRLLQQLKTNSSRSAMQEPYEKDFETIYNEAQEKDINLSNAKEFLNTLSSDELSTLQHYTGLADEINVDSLSNEGAYNLLMHDYEKYDFNNDGMVQNGIGNLAPILPNSMDDHMKESYIQALNSLDESKRLDAMAISTLGYATSALNRLDETNHRENTAAAPLTYEILATRIDSILHPQNGSYASTALQDTISEFWENFKTSYNS